MYIDNELLLSNSQAHSAVGDNISTNVIDGAVLERNLGIGEALSAYVGIDVSADIADADETYSVRLEESVDEAFTSPIVIAQQDFDTAKATTDLVLGGKVVLPFPHQPTAGRYYRVNIFTAGTTPAITTTTFIQPSNMIQNEFLKGYPTAYVVA